MQLDGATAPVPMADFGEPGRNLLRTENGTWIALWATESDVWQRARPEGRGWVVFDESTNTFVAVWSQPSASGVPDVLSSVYR